MNRDLKKLIVQVKKFIIGVLGFNVGLELLSGPLPTVWGSSLRMVRRHAITILIFHGGDGFLGMVPPEV